MTIGQDLFSRAGKVAIVTGAGGRPNGIGETVVSDRLIAKGTV